MFAELVDRHAGGEEAMFNMARGMFSAEKRAQSDVDYETWKASSPGMSVVAQAMQEMAVRMA